MGSKSTQHSGAMDGREAELMGGGWIRELTLVPEKVNHGYGGCPLALL